VAETGVVADSVAGLDQTPVADSDAGHEPETQVPVADSVAGLDQTPVADSDAGHEPETQVPVADSVAGLVQTPVDAVSVDGLVHTPVGLVHTALVTGVVAEGEVSTLEDHEPQPPVVVAATSVECERAGQLVTVAAQDVMVSVSVSQTVSVPGDWL